MATAKRFVIPTVDEIEENAPSTSQLSAHSRFERRHLKRPIDNSNQVQVQMNKIKATGQSDEGNNNNERKTNENITNETAVTCNSTTCITTTATTSSSNAKCNTVTAAICGARNTNCILVNPRQRGNPIIKFVRSVPLEYSEITPDYILGVKTCALFLSLRYHTLKPDYIHDRLKQLGRQFQLTVILVQVDVKDPHHAIKELTKIALLADCVLLLAWSPEEAGRYLEIYKVFENKPPDLIQERKEADSISKVVDAISSVKSVNKTNAMSLLSSFKSLNNIVKASSEDLSFCPGMGEQKATRMYETLHQPFRQSKKKR